MIANINTIAFQGISTIIVDAQIHIAKGIPAFHVVGLPDKTVAESRERIRAALTSINLSLPARRITVNLSPADLFKEGSHYDLPIAIGLLITMGALPSTSIKSYVIMGELSLDGSIIPVSGVLPAAISASKQKKGIICSYENGAEAALVDGITIIALKNLTELISYFNRKIELSAPEKIIRIKNTSIPDMKDVKGQAVAKRALEIAAAGGHNLLMVGPPGTGKSMLAKRLPGLLPELSNEKIMEINVISSITNKFDGSIDTNRPFREPHSSCSMAAMVGGGRNANPGEITLAHNGILFLDELPEFSRAVLDSLRQPLENKHVTISRANAHITYPSDFQLVAAMNPCRCGYLGDPEKSCSKAPRCGSDYQGKISGPLLDRIDIHVEVSHINILSNEFLTTCEDTKTIKARVMDARKIQEERYSNFPFASNVDISREAFEEFIVLDKSSKTLLERVLNENYISARGYTRILKVARTIADLYQEQNIKKSHIVEALNYRLK